MHDTVESWVRAQVDAFHLGERSVLEVGSCQLYNGGYGDFPRGLFHQDYAGIDRVTGPGTDLIHDIEQAPVLTPTGLGWEVVLCLEVLEHTPHPWVAIHHMAQSLRPGGSLLISVRGYDKTGYAPVHMEPHDYWRFSVTGLRVLLEDEGLHVLTCIEDPSLEWRGVLAHAVK